MAKVNLEIYLFYFLLLLVDFRSDVFMVSIIFQIHLALQTTLMSPEKLSHLNGTHLCVMEAVRLWPTALRNGKGMIAGLDATLLMSVNVNTQLLDLVPGTDLSSE